MLEKQRTLELLNLDKAFLHNAIALTKTLKIKTNEVVDNCVINKNLVKKISDDFVETKYSKWGVIEIKKQAVLYIENTSEMIKLRFSNLNDWCKNNAEYPYNYTCYCKYRGLDYECNFNEKRFNKNDFLSWLECVEKNIQNRIEDVINAIVNIDTYKNEKKRLFQEVKDFEEEKQFKLLRHYDSYECVRWKLDR